MHGAIMASLIPCMIFLSEGTNVANIPPSLTSDIESSFIDEK